MATHVHELQVLPEEEARHVFPEKQQLHALFAFFICKTCGEHLYMLKEDLEKRSEYWPPHNGQRYVQPTVIDLSNITEHGAMFFYDQEAKEWVLLYTIIR